MKKRKQFRIPNGVNDMVFTPDHIAAAIIDRFKPTGICLDPCAGEGAFLKHLPNGSDWCEIRKGRDFFDYDKNVEWCIGNPPYSIFPEFMEKSFAVSENVVFLSPIGKIFSSMDRIRKIFEYGGIKHILLVSPKDAGFPFGFPTAAIHFQKDYTGPMFFEWLDYEKKK